jgi:hypothetical protein
MIPAVAAGWQRLIAQLARRRAPAADPADGAAEPEPAPPARAANAAGGRPDAQGYGPASPPADPNDASPDADQARSHDPGQQEEETMSVGAADLSPFHHPHFIAGELTSRDAYGAYYAFQFSPFSGDEAEPRLPDKNGVWERVSSDDYRFLAAEYECAYTMWAQARFRLAAAPMLQAAAPVWQEYDRAREAMAAAFAAFWETSDGAWRAQILRLTDAHAQAVAAAEKWDATACGLARAWHDHLGDVGETRELDLQDVASGVGLDISRWDIDSADAYAGSWARNWPAARAALEEIERQKERLKEVDELAAALLRLNG